MEATALATLGPQEALSNTAQKRGRRARAACEVCRSKKVRCDSRGGLACSNCTFDGVPCVLAPRRLKKSGKPIKSTTLAPKPMPQNSGSDNNGIGMNVAAPPPIQYQPEAPQSFASVSSPSIETELHSLPDPQVWTSNIHKPSASSPSDSFLLCKRSDPSTASIYHGSSVADLPEYIKPFPTSIDPDDIQYLRAKGVLRLPDRDVRDACLASYFQHVQPMYPIVDPVTISSLLEGSGSSNEKLSLLLFYAFIFVGGTWIDVRLVRKSGFLSRNAFRKSVHRKMRLLYDADYETDRECLIQVFILWTFWFEGPNENKDGWHWIGVALSLSRVIGLHQTSSESNQSKTAMNRLRRRLWWSLATRDAICSFALSRCPRIADPDYNVSMLEVSDFEPYPATVMLLGAIPQTLRHQQTIAQICVLYVKLVNIFGKICKLAYPESSCGKASVLYSSQQLQGKDSINISRPSSMTERLALFQKHLDEWRQSVPDDLWHISSIPSNLNAPESVEVVHRGLLSMMYYATVMVLHRPQMLPADSVDDGCDSSVKTTPDPSRAMVRFAARQIIQIAMDFYEEDMVRSLAATCITCLILASISQIFDMTSKEEAIRSEASQRLEQCKAIFHAFSEQQVGGQWALEVMSYITYRLEHQRRGQQLENPVTKSNLISTPDRETDMILSYGDINETVELTSSKSAMFPPETRQRDMTELLNGDIPDASATSGVPAFDVSRPVFSTADVLFSPSTWEQPLPDSLMGFLGPDFVWPDFPHALSENPDNLTWTNTRSD